jgi:hypothetical protein
MPRKPNGVVAVLSLRRGGVNGMRTAAGAFSRRFGVAFLAALLPQLALSAAPVLLLEPRWSDAGWKLVMFSFVIYRPMLPVTESIAGFFGLRGSGGLKGLRAVGFTLCLTPVLGAFVYSLVIAALASLLTAWMDGAIPAGPTAAATGQTATGAVMAATPAAFARQDEDRRAGLPGLD